MYNGGTFYDQTCLSNIYTKLLGFDMTWFVLTASLKKGKNLDVLIYYWITCSWIFMVLPHENKCYVAG